MDTKTVLIVDDHPMFRRGVRDAIEADSSLKVVGEASSGAEALSLVETLSPEVIVSDVDMPEMDGLQLAQELLNRNPDSRIVILTMHREQKIFDHAMEIGILAFVSKDEVVDEIIQAIEYAADGRCYIPSSLSELVINRTRQNAQTTGRSSKFSSLTPTERSVLKKVAENKTSKEIAHDLGVSARTVSTHRNNISRKLAVGGSMPLVNFALIHRDEILEL